MTASPAVVWWTITIPLAAGNRQGNEDSDDRPERPVRACRLGLDSIRVLVWQRLSGTYSGPATGTTMKFEARRVIETAVEISARRGAEPGGWQSVLDYLAAAFAKIRWQTGRREIPGKRSQSPVSLILSRPAANCTTPVRVVFLSHQVQCGARPQRRPPRTQAQPSCWNWPEAGRPRDPSESRRWSSLRQGQGSIGPPPEIWPARFSATGKSSRPCC